MPRASIILTTYNRPERLERAIESVLSQTFKDFELLLMDDNSDDPKQIEVLNKYKDYDRINLHISDVEDEDRSKSVRYSVLINEAFKVAKGEFIAYICDDDRFEPDRIERFIHKFDLEPDVHFIGGDQICVIERNGLEEPMPNHVRTQTTVNSNPNCQVDHTSVMHRSSVLEKVPQWKEDPTYWGSADGEFFEELGKAGFPMHPLLGHPTDTHVYHDGSWTKDDNHTKLGTVAEKGVSQ